MTPERPEVVLLAGATGAVGLAAARKLLGEGTKLALPVRRPWQVAKLRAALADLDRGPSDLLIGTTGEKDAESIAGFVKGAEDALGEIGGFVSTLGAFHLGEVGRERADQADELFEANVLANHRFVRALLPRFRRRGRGHLVFCGAAALQQEETPPGLALYLASKAALDRYAMALANEVQDDGLSVTVLSLGVIDTEANREAMPGASRDAWTPIEAVVTAIEAGLSLPRDGASMPSNFHRPSV